MPNFYSVPLFRCESCFALYQVVKAPAGTETADLEIACPVCNAPLPAREGQFVLKYFLLRKASRTEVGRARRGFRHKKASAAQSPGDRVVRGSQVADGRAAREAFPAVRKS